MRDEQVLSRHGGAQANGRVAAAQSRLRMRNTGGRSEPFTWGNKLAGAPYFGAAAQDRRTDLTFRFLPGGGPPSEFLVMVCVKRCAPLEVSWHSLCGGRKVLRRRL